MAAGRGTRPSPIAGQWYPEDAGTLSASVDGYLAAARLPEIAGRPVAVVAPHAGHAHSGAVAGHAFRALQGLHPDVVAVVGPMHYPSPAAVLTSGHEAYATPLDPVPVDREAVRALGAALRADAGIDLVTVRNDPEHSIEIELPFLQRALGATFQLLPVMVRAERPEVLRALGRALARVLAGRPAIVVASTDLSHYYPQSLAVDLDRELLRHVEAFDPEAVLRAEVEGRGFACGIGALAASLWAARDLGGDVVRVLHYGTSGDVTGDYDSVVGYAAAVVTRPGG